MNKRWRKAMARVWLFLVGWLVVGWALAAPDYVTAWPRQVPIGQPDPVLGDRLYWEHWVYSEAFAKRFAGTTDGKRFSVEGADPELKGKLYALVLRIYKINQWAGTQDDYPKQYTCEIDVYFDANIELALQETRMVAIPEKLRNLRMTPSYGRLIAASDKDNETIRQSKAAEFYLFRYPAIFALPPDGRLRGYPGSDYRRPLVTGLSFIRLIGDSLTGDCAIAVPSHPQGSDWLSLKGIHPYRSKNRENQPDVGAVVKGSYDRKYEGLTFDPGPDPESQGLFRIPRSFHEVALQKAALVKVMNWCIARRHSPSDWRVSRTAEGWSRTFTHEDLMQRCEQAERYGRILPDPRYHPNADGLMDTGY